MWKVIGNGDWLGNWLELGLGRWVSSEGQVMVGEGVVMLKNIIIVHIMMTLLVETSSLCSWHKPLIDSAQCYMKVKTCRTQNTTGMADQKKTLNLSNKSSILV